MRLPATLDTDDFPIAERCALRLDGDCFDLGLTGVAVDAIVDRRLRASTLVAATRTLGLVVETWSAAWVHGAVPVLPRPLNLAVEVPGGVRTRSLVPPPREVRFGPEDVVMLGGVRVTTATRTAIDLARLAVRFDGAVVDVVLTLLEGVGSDPVAAAVQAEAGARGPHKARGVERLLALRGRVAQRASAPEAGVRHRSPLGRPAATADHRG